MAPPQPYRIETRISRRARRLRLEMYGADAVRLIIPHGCPEPVAPRFLAGQQQWIARQQQRWHLRPKTLPQSAAPWDGIAPLPWGGQRLPVRHRHGDVPDLRLEDDGFVAFSHRDAHIKAALWTTLARRCLATATRAQAEALIRVEAARMGAHPAGLRISDTRAQWGSCSARGIIQLCWRLGCAPPEVMRYVVIHELAHLRHRHHGPAFWNRVAAYCPDHALHRAWLRREGPALMALLPLG